MNPSWGSVSLWVYSVYGPLFLLRALGWHKSACLFFCLSWTCILTFVINFLYFTFLLSLSPFAFLFFFLSFFFLFNQVSYLCACVCCFILHSLLCHSIHVHSKILQTFEDLFTFLMWSSRLYHSNHDNSVEHYRKVTSVKFSH